MNIENKQAVTGRVSESPLRRFRRAHGLRVVDIAAAARASIDTVRRIDRLDVVTLRLGSLVKVSQAVGVPPAVLVPGLKWKPPSASLTPRAPA